MVSVGANRNNIHKMAASWNSDLCIWMAVLHENGICSYIAKVLP